MRFHGFESVDAWLAEFPRLKDNQWFVTRQTWKRDPGKPLFPCGFPVSSDAVPYGDPITDIRDDEPEAVDLVCVTINTPTAAWIGHLFRTDLSAYYGDGDSTKMIDALVACGFQPSSNITIVSI